MPPPSKTRRGGLLPATRRGWAALPVVVAGLACVGLVYGWRVGLVASVDEDAYISLRYARNLLRGDGLVFNPGGERVEGITNLLWTLLVAGFSWLTGIGLPTAALGLGVACGALTLLLAYLLCARVMAVSGLAGPAAASLGLAAPLLLVLVPGFTFYAASGLETPLFALLLVCGLWAAVLPGYVSYAALAVCGLALGAATLTRPEGALALAAGSGAVLLGCLLDRRPRYKGEALRRALAFALPGGLVVGAATLWRLSYYGSVLPNTAYAKSGDLEVVEQWGLPYLVEAASGTGFLAAWGLALAAACVSRRFLLCGLPGLLLIPAWAAYVVYVGGDYMPSHRLLVPVLPVVFALAAAAPAPIVSAVTGVTGEGQSGRLRGVSAYGLAALPVVALGVILALQLPAHLEVEWQHKADNDLWTEYRRAAANWFDENAPDALVAANSVGAFGYYSEVRIVDMLGLNDEHIARRGSENPEQPPGHQVGDGEYVLAREPDYIIPFGMKPGYGIYSTGAYFIGDRQLAGSREFREEYESTEVNLQDGPDGAGETLSMFRRGGEGTG